MKKILRNVSLVLIILAICIVLALVAAFGQVVLDWFKTIGWTYILTIALTTLACAVIFGVADTIEDKKREAESKEDKKNKSEDL